MSYVSQQTAVLFIHTHTDREMPERILLYITPSDKSSRLSI